MSEAEVADRSRYDRYERIDAVRVWAHREINAVPCATNLLIMHGPFKEEGFLWHHPWTLLP